jgi:hypothetical protein
MDDLIQLNHQELSLLLFSLERDRVASVPDASSCEDACPVVDTLEELLCGGTIDTRQQLVRHLNNHIREGLIETGMFQLLAARESPHSQARAPLQEEVAGAHDRLNAWTCSVRFTEDERIVLKQSLKRVPLSAWLSVPRTLWKLKKKLNG